MLQARHFSGTCKLVVTDIDFTFVGGDKQIPPRNLQALEVLKAAGIPLAIATGRYWRGIKKLVGELGLTTPQITDNGATIIDPRDERVILSHPLGEELTTIFYDSFRKDGLCPVVGTPMDYFAEEPDAMSVAIMRIHNEYAIPLPAKELRALFTTCVKQTLYVEDARIPALRTAVEKARNAATAAHLSFGGFYTEPGIFTLNAMGVDKLGGVKDLCRVVGYTLDDVLAIGDGDNDAGMLAACGLGCAVANATPAAKEAASCIVASCDNAGFAEAVFRVF